jgi:hypothetical protein
MEITMETTLEQETPFKKPLLFLPVGISGSGKSYLFTLLQSHFNLNEVCMDSLRKELTGNISDQSKNDEIWALSRKKAGEYLAKKENVYYNATNLKTATLEDFIAYYGCLADIVIIYCNDSFNKELCRSRVIEDISNGIDRPDTSENGTIEKHYNRWISMAKTSDKIYLKKIAEEKNVKIFFETWSINKNINDIIPSIKLWQKSLEGKRGHGEKNH